MSGVLSYFWPKCREQVDRGLGITNVTPGKKIGDPWLCGWVSSAGLSLHPPSARHACNMYHTMRHTLARTTSMRLRSCILENSKDFGFSTARSCRSPSLPTIFDASHTPPTLHKKAIHSLRLHISLELCGGLEDVRWSFIRTIMGKKQPSVAHRTPRHGRCPIRTLPV